MNHLHLINKRGSFYVYIPSTYNIVKVNKLTFKVLQMLQLGASKDDICKIFDVNQREIEEMEFFLWNIPMKYRIHNIRWVTAKKKSSIELPCMFRMTATYAVSIVMHLVDITKMTEG